MVRWAQPVRDKVAAQLRGQPRVSATLVRALRRAGLDDLSARIDRVTVSPHSVTVIELPGGAGCSPWTIMMDSAGGRDQVARDLKGGWDRFEPPMPAVLLAVCRGFEGTVLDVGANTGIYSLYAAAGAGRTVVAFEPIPAIADLMERNLRLSMLTDKVRVERCAVGSTVGTAAIYLPPDTGWIETSASLSADFKEQIATSQEVPVLTLDSWYEQAHRPTVSVVKIDVESGEADVLAGAELLAGEQRPLMFVEILPRADVRALSDFARRHHLVDIRLYPEKLLVADDGADLSFDPGSWNHLLVPQGKLEMTLQLLEPCEVIHADNRR